MMPPLPFSYARTQFQPRSPALKLQHSFLLAIVRSPETTARAICAREDAEGGEEGASWRRGLGWPGLRGRSEARKVGSAGVPTLRSLPAVTRRRRWSRV